MQENFPTDLTERKLSSELIYEGPIISLKVDEVALPSGRTGRREVVVHPGGVVIVPITKEGDFVLVEQFRYAPGQLLLEFPAGRLNGKGEDPLAAAKRELAEETGYVAGEIKLLTYAYTAPGFCNEKLYIYLATDLTPGNQNPDEDEFVKVHHFSRKELAQKIAKGEITDAKTLAGWGLVQEV